MAYYHHDHSILAQSKKEIVALQQDVRPARLYRDLAHQNGNARPVRRLTIVGLANQRARIDVFHVS